MSLTIILLIALALFFDFVNGFHDSANSIATVVSTRVLRPYQAVLWAAFFNFVAFLVFHLNVAGTIGKDIVGPEYVNNRVIAATLLAACAWNIFTWYLGLPTSSSHALTFSLVGAGLATAGLPALRWHGLGNTTALRWATALSLSSGSISSSPACGPCRRPGGLGWEAAAPPLPGFACRPITPLVVTDDC